MPKRERRRSPRQRKAAPPGQYSLFAAIEETTRNAQHFRRQAELCERLLSGVHQPDLCDALQSLHEEFEAAARAADLTAGRSASRS